MQSWGLHSCASVIIQRVSSLTRNHRSRRRNLWTCALHTPLLLCDSVQQSKASNHCGYSLLLREARVFAPVCVKTRCVHSRNPFNAIPNPISFQQISISKLLEGKSHRTLTPMHANLLQLCLLAKCYHVGEEVCVCVRCC